MKRLSLAFLFSLLIGAASAQLSGGLMFPGPGTPAASGGGCSQATALIARTSGMSGTEITATTNLICGMVTDGDYVHLDGLYVFATNSTTTATLNWAQNAFNLTWTSLGTCAFAADTGLTGDASACFASTGFTPSTAAGHMTATSASIGACVLTSRTVTQNYVAVGASNNSGSVYSYVQPLQGGSLQYEIQGSTFPSYSVAGNSRGSWIATRSPSVTLFQNGISVSTPASDPSGALINEPIFVMALNSSGSVSDITGDQIAYTFFGDGSVNATNVRNRLQTYIAALGGSGC